VWRGYGVASDIATILHRDTLAVLVGDRTFEQGEACFAEGAVVDIVAGRGELRGTVRGGGDGAAYAVRMWIRDDGFAYRCACPAGSKQELCKHTIALALAHLDRERTAARDPTTTLRDRLAALDRRALVDRLVERARGDRALHAALLQICDELA
jgi:uncharacterized Zn finger protein